MGREVVRIVGLGARDAPDDEQASKQEPHGNDEEPERDDEVRGARELTARLPPAGNDDERGSEFVRRDLEASRRFWSVPLDEARLGEPGVPLVSAEPFRVRFALEQDTRRASEIER